MKYVLGLAAVVCALAASTMSAAQLSVTPYPNNVDAIFIDGESTVFNALGFSATPIDGAMFLNINSGGLSFPQPPGNPFTYRNRLLDVDPIDFPESKGWTLLGVINTHLQQAFVGGPLGQTIDTSTEPNGDLFLANLMLPANATATVQVTLVNGIDTVFEQSIIVGVPEPATLALAAIAALGLAAVRRRRTRLTIH